MKDTKTVRIGAGIDFTDPQSSLAPWYAQVSHVLTALILGLIFLLVSWFPLWHTDIWGHVRFGEEIVRQRGWPAQEPLAIRGPGRTIKKKRWGLVRSQPAPLKTRVKVVG